MGIAAGISGILAYLAIVIAFKMQFKIEKRTSEFLNTIGIHAFLPQIVEANRTINRLGLPKDYQKWVMVILGDNAWQLYCKDISGNLLFQEVLTIKEPIDTNIIEVTLVIKDGLLKAVGQIVFDKSESVHSLEINTTEMSTLLE